MCLEGGVYLAVLGRVGLKLGARESIAGVGESEGKGTVRELCCVSDIRCLFLCAVKGKRWPGRCYWAANVRGGEEGKGESGRRWEGREGGEETLGEVIVGRQWDGWRGGRTVGEPIEGIGRR